MTSQRSRQNPERNVINFLSYFAATPGFDELYNHGINLIETTAAYLDGDGRQAHKSLPKHLAAEYVTESMHLTTRLMHVASWLFLQRAFNSNEINQRKLVKETYALNQRLKVYQPLCRNFRNLPHELQKLVRLSRRLQKRIEALSRSSSA